MSDKKDILLFEHLKDKVASTLRKKYPGNHENISQWKGQEIKHFQDDLIEKVQGRISEKWFYTHLKSDKESVPRIDILNLLCRYCDYEDWIDFKAKHQHLATRKNTWKYITGISIIILLTAWFAFSTRYYKYSIEIIDAYTLQPIRDARLEIIWIDEHESPKHFHELVDGKLSLKSENKEVTLIIKAPYYFSDTIERRIPHKHWEEKIPLQPDDFSLMIRYFSESDQDLWNERREQLRQVFSYNAAIFQVDNQGKGMAIYNQEEFIDKLSFPTSRLKNIEVLESRMSKGKIVYLRFKTEDNEIN